MSSGGASIICCNTQFVLGSSIHSHSSKETEYSRVNFTSYTQAQSYCSTDIAVNVSC